MSSSSIGQLVDRLGQAEDDAVVAPHQLDLHAPPLAEAVLQGHRPRRVHLGAERREDADPPVADLVAEPLDDDRAVVGHDAGGLGLLVEVGDEVARPPARRGRARRAARASASAGGRARSSRTNSPDGPAQLERAARARRRARTASSRAGPGAGRDDHLLEGDVLDAPGGRAEQERLARAALVDHLLVELADPGAVGQEDARTGPRSGMVPALVTARRWAPGAAAHGALHPVPHDAGPQLGELLGRVAARRAGRARRRAPRRTARRSWPRRRTTAARSSTGHSSSAHMATICWASTSSGLRG